MDGGDGIFQSIIRQKSISSLFGKSGKRWLWSSDEDGSPQSETISQLSPFANSVVSRCARILLSSPLELQQKFETELPERVQDSSSNARNFLEYCSFRSLQIITKNPKYLAVKELRRLTYDMMVAWEEPGSEVESKPKENASSSSIGSEEEDAESLFSNDSTSAAAQVDRKRTVGREAFCRIAPNCPLIADVITVHNLFDALTCSSEGLLHFLLYDKYLGSLDKVLRSAKNALSLPLASSLPLSDGEIILDIDGNIPIQPVLQHIGTSAWPGRLTLTSRAFYFESLGVGSYDKATVYDLAIDSKQIIKRDLIGPLGSRIFDKGVMFKSNSLEENVYFEFPELKGHSRRDYWLAIMREVLHVHKFIRKFDLQENQQAEAISKAIIGILQYRAVKEVFHIIPSRTKTFLPFSLAENIPRGDEILEALHNHLETPSDGFLPISALALCVRGLNVTKKGIETEEIESKIEDFYVGGVSPLEKAVRESISYSSKAETARASVEQVKVEGIDTNLAVMKGLLFPLIDSCEKFQYLSSWEDPFKSTVFLVFINFFVFRGWIRYLIPCIFMFLAVLMLWHKHWAKGKALEPFRIVTPPSKNAVEQILILQEAISQVETLIQAGNVILLKLRSILLASVPQTTDKVAVILAGIGIVFLFIPLEHLLLLGFLELYTREMPLRKYSSEKLSRRVREWWVRIPAAPVKLIPPEDPKKRN